MYMQPLLPRTGQFRVPMYGMSQLPGTAQRCVPLLMLCVQHLLSGKLPAYYIASVTISFAPDASFPQPQDDAKHMVPVTINELLLRGCTLKNSGFILGLVIYTGAETRIQMNSTAPPRKQGAGPRVPIVQDECVPAHGYGQSSMRKCAEGGGWVWCCRTLTMVVNHHSCQPSRKAVTRGQNSRASPCCMLCHWNAEPFVFIASGCLTGKLLLAQAHTPGS